SGALDLSRWTMFVAVCLLALFVLTAAPALTPLAHAQDEGAGAAKDVGAAGPPTVGKKPSLFIHIIHSAGWVFGPVILIISVGLVALIVLLSMDLRMGTSIPPGFVEDFTETVNQR